MRLLPRTSGVQSWVALIPKNRITRRSAEVCRCFLDRLKNSLGLPLFGGHRRESTGQNSVACHIAKPGNGKVPFSLSNVPPFYLLCVNKHTIPSSLCSNQGLGSRLFGMVSADRYWSGPCMQLCRTDSVCACGRCLVAIDHPDSPPHTQGPGLLHN
jgi:hypothetical protein